MKSVLKQGLFHEFAFNVKVFRMSRVLKTFKVRMLSNANANFVTSLNEIQISNPSRCAGHLLQRNQVQRVNILCSLIQGLLYSHVYGSNRKISASCPFRPPI